MTEKIELKQKAIGLRKKGLSYSEILKEINVAKSTLSEWFIDVGIGKRQRQRLTEKKRLGQLRGAKSRRDQRLRVTNEIHNSAEKEIGSITKRDLWILGTALYWAEGSKQREKSVGSGVIFSNSDPEMVKIFLKWLFDILKVKREEIRFEIYLHENHIHRMTDVQKKWAEVCDFPLHKFAKVYFKKNKINTKRTNTGNLYYGQLRVKVSASSNLYRRIDGWKIGICKNICGIV